MEDWDSMPRELDAKERRFVSEYLIDLDAYAAAQRAEFQPSVCKKPNRFYVYLLIDPRNGEIFYVGKGKNKRYSDHAKQCDGFYGANVEKISRIQSIHSSGNSIVAWCLKDGISESSALSLEREVIGLIGLSRLTNAARGKSSSLEASKISASVVIARLKPFHTWLDEKPRSEAEISLAQRVHSELHFIARHGQIREMLIHNGQVEFS